MKANWIEEYICEDCETRFFLPCSGNPDGIPTIHCPCCCSDNVADARLFEIKPIG